MSLRRALRGIGLICLTISAVWWFGFFQKVALAMGVRIDGLVQDAWPCLFYTTAPCRIAYTVAELAGSPSYRPFLTWIGLCLWALGMVLPVGKSAPRSKSAPQRIEPRF